MSESSEKTPKKALRRARGEGNMRQRPDGRYEGRVALERGADGKRKRKSIYADSQAELTREMNIASGRAETGQLLVSSTPRVKQFLNEWYADHQHDWTPNTRWAFRQAIDRRLIPAFGSIRIEKLTTPTIQKWIRQQRHPDTGKLRRVIVLAYGTLHLALEYARSQSYVVVNTAGAVALPKRKKGIQVKPFDAAEAKAFIDACQGHRLGVLFTVAIACGLRIGEALGLRWTDVNLDTGEVTLEVQLQYNRFTKVLELVDLKTENSHRTFILPPICLVAMRAHRKRQQEERLRAGARWVNTGLVFTTYTTRGKRGQVGNMQHPNNVLNTLYQILAKAKLRRLTFHALRHNAATLLLAQGVQMAEISKLLGHANIRITADLYSHFQKQIAVRAAGHMETILTTGRHS